MGVHVKGLASGAMLVTETGDRFAYHPSHVMYVEVSAVCPTMGDLEWELAEHGLSLSDPDEIEPELLPGPRLRIPVEMLAGGFMALTREDEDAWA